MALKLIKEEKAREHLFEARFGEGVIIRYRKIGMPEFQKIRKQHVKYEWQRGQGKVPVFDEEAIFWSIIDFIVAAWDGIVDENDQPVPCTIEWKKRLPTQILSEIQDLAGAVTYTSLNGHESEEYLEADLKNS